MSLTHQSENRAYPRRLQQPMLLMLLGIIGVLGLSKKQIDGSELVALVLFSWAALTARRNFGPFAIIAAPILANHLVFLVEDIKDSLKNKYEKVDKFFVSTAANNQNFNPKLKNVLNLTILCLLFGTAVWKISEVNQPDLIAKTEREIFPVDAVQWLEDNETNGNLFNEYNWGGYLIWHNRETPVFVDGRTDLFGDEILTDYLTLMTVQGNWNKVIDQYEIKTLLLKSESNLENIASYEGWNILYKDSVAVILVK